MLHVFDILLHLAHLSLISFNLFGWLFRRTRLANLVCLLLTGMSWFALGQIYGLGYCPLTDWPWQVKLKLGEYDWPNSYIKYIADRLTGMEFDAGMIDAVTAISYFAALIVSVMVNIRKPAVNK